MWMRQLVSCLVYPSHKLDENNKIRLYANNASRPNISKIRQSISEHVCRSEACISCVLPVWLCSRFFGKSEISFKGECGRRWTKLQKLPFSLLGDNLFLERLLCSRNLPSHITTHLRLQVKFISEMPVRQFLYLSASHRLADGEDDLRSIIHAL